MVVVFSRDQEFVICVGFSSRGFDLPGVCFLVFFVRCFILFFFFFSEDLGFLSAV